MKDASSAKWLAQGLNSVLGSLQEAGEEAEVIAANLSAPAESNELDNGGPLLFLPPHSLSDAQLQQDTQMWRETSDPGSSDLIFGNPDAVQQTENSGCSINKGCI